VHTIYLSLGTNLGSREDNLERALHLLQEQVGALLRRSSVYGNFTVAFAAVSDNKTD